MAARDVQLAPNPEQFSPDFLHVERRLALQQWREAVQTSGTNRFPVSNLHSVVPSQAEGATLTWHVRPSDLGGMAAFATWPQDRLRVSRLSAFRVYWRVRRTALSFRAAEPRQAKKS